MTLVDQAANVRKRLDGQIQIIGVTESDMVAWTLDHQPIRWTHEFAVEHADDWARKSGDGMTQLDGLWLNSDDTFRLMNYLAEHPDATIAHCGECGAPCAVADSLCGVHIHEITEGDE